MNVSTGLDQAMMACDLNKILSELVPKYVSSILSNYR